MRKFLHSRLVQAVATVTALGVASTASALPWDVDLVDQQMVKPFEQRMRLTPEGSVAQPNVLTPRIGGYFDIDTAATINAFPEPSTLASVAEGEELWGVYCSVCHGYGNVKGTAMQSGRFPDHIIGRMPTQTILNVWPIGLTYKAIRYGKMGTDGVTSHMPSYGWAMTEPEMWSIIHYLKQTSNPPVDGGAQ
jgi:mono/diheme cytochrome c family protein